MSKSNRTRKNQSITITRHQPASRADRLHMRALHLATVKQIGEGR